MKHLTQLIVYFFIPACLFAQTETYRPWEDTSKPIVIDVYKGNTYNIKDLLKDQRVKGIIHKMSEEDSAIFYKRRIEAKANNLFFGSYWLPKHDSNGAAQADLYLKMVGESNLSSELLAIDFEMHKKTKEFISPTNTYLFVQRIFEKTGRYPYLYCGLNNLSKLENSPYADTFKKCKLWLISLGKTGDISPSFHKNKIWKTYSLWQFSCEINCCKKDEERPCFYRIHKIECGTDYDVFNGTYDSLVQNWAN